MLSIYDSIWQKNVIIYEMYIEKKRCIMRFAKYDNLKCFLMFTVVMGHMILHYSPEYPVFTGFYLFIYVFHMPAFFFVSGLFSKKTVDNNRIWKVTPYLILYFGLKFAFSIVARIFTESFYEEPFFSEDGLPWFVLCLFFCYVISMGVKRFKPGYVMVIAVILSIFAGYSPENRDLFVWLKVVNFFPFFYMGYIMEPAKLAERLNHWLIKLCSIVALLFTLGVCIRYEDKLYTIRPLLTGRDLYLKLGEHAEAGPFLRAALFGISFVIIFMLISITPKRKMIFSVLGQRTLGIFCVHYLLIKIIYNLGYQEFIEKYFPGCWPVVVCLTGVAVFVICSNRYITMGIQKIFDERWKLRKL